MGGTHSKKLSLAAKEIWTWCEARKLWIFASYISSKDNAIADYESRRLEPETEQLILFYNMLIRIGGYMGAVGMMRTLNFSMWSI
ncbi:unnamed protein product [Trichogramma brassicae]|uniref:Uncharacterized protein n=1 Tax=Trichogramma brassicae TaxID=86971 RepID=A0A6H5J6W4_9HYME|nr:unnamed protein product [Trichogramma brassicae]